MEHLRLILFVLGAALIVGIWLWDVARRRRARRDHDTELDDAYLEALEGTSDDLLEVDALAGLSASRDAGPVAIEGLAPIVPGSGRSAVRADPPPGAGDDLVLALTVMARGGGRFAGGDVAAALGSVGARFGAMRIYHGHGDPAGGAGDVREPTVTPIYSVANVLKPGTFEPQAMESFSTPGLSIFQRLPCEIDGLAAFEIMHEAARRLAQQLDGTLCDERRNPLTRQALGHLRERVSEFVRRQRLAR